MNQSCFVEIVALYCQLESPSAHAKLHVFSGIMSAVILALHASYIV